MDFTKGEWVLELDSFNEYHGWTTHKVKSNRKTICKVYATQKKESMANAKLIAAAPNLLEACKLIIDPLTGLVYDGVSKQIGSEQAYKIEQAIEKALK